MERLQLFIVLCFAFLNIQQCLSLDEIYTTTTEEVGVPLAILLPNATKDGGCTYHAIKMAIDDINSIKDLIVRKVSNSSTKTTKNTIYKLEPYYGETLETVGDAIEALHLLYKNKTKISTIGPPFKDQNEYITEYTTANANMHISYSEANEPMESYFIMLVRTPPSISSSFKAAASLMSEFNWSRTGMIYDYSDFRYRKNVDKLRDIISNNNRNEIIADQGIWSIPVQYSVSKELGVLQDKGTRIVLTLVSVSGARKVFCEAYHRKMYRPKVIWVLFETLPEDWASDKYDAWATHKYDGYHMEREIKCSEEELLIAADGYISITKQGLRRDHLKTISNMTPDDFRTRLQQSVNKNVQCEENVAYAYDAMWVLAKGYEGRAKEHDLLNYKYHDFANTLQIAEKIHNVSFEALTGPLKYEKDVLSTMSRIGQLTLWVNHKGEKSTYFGTHDTASNTSKLLPDAKKIVFKSGIIPKDRALYKITYANIDEALLIIMWLLSFLGILMCLIFLVLSIFLMNYRYSVLDTPFVDCVLLTGSIFCYLSVIIYGVDTRYALKENIPKTCTAFLSMLSIGFTLAFGSLFAKTWKLYKLYMTPEIKVENNKQLDKNKDVPEWILLAMVTSLVVGDAILLTCWSVTAPFENQTYNVTTNSNQFENVIEIKQIIRCKCENQTQFTIGIYCYKGLLLIFGLFLAWQTRNAKLKCKNDSKQISMAIYNVVAVSVIGVICVTVLANTTRHQAMFSIIAVCIIICTTTTLLLVFLNKMRRAIRGDYKDFQLETNRSIGGKESPKTKYTLEYMRKPVGSLDIASRQISTNTLTTQISTESPTSVHYTKYGTSPGVSSVVSVNPTYLHSSPYIPPPDYSESSTGTSKLSSGIYVGSISEEESEQLKEDLSSKESNSTVESTITD